MGIGSPLEGLLPKSRFLLFSIPQVPNSPLTQANRQPFSSTGMRIGLRLRRLRNTSGEKFTAVLPGPTSACRDTAVVPTYIRDVAGRV